MAIKAYELMDATEGKTLRVEQCGDIYVDGGCDIACTITDEDGSELAYAEFDECTSALTMSPSGRMARASSSPRTRMNSPSASSRAHCSLVSEAWTRQCPLRGA